MKIALSNLIADRQNPRRVKPERDAHRRLVASIRAHGLLEPLLVRPEEGNKHTFRVIAGGRRLAALKEVHRGEDPTIDCVVKKVDAETASAMSLAENFVREPMHPLDEAEAFARLARDEALGVEAIAGQFGVSKTYVRQRMKLAGLAEVVKGSLRRDDINLSTAEAFAAVPPERQVELWKEVHGKPRDGDQVRNLIRNDWVPITYALFDVNAVDPTAVSEDLFGGRVLMKRSVFFDAQSAALIALREQLLDEGWKEVRIGDREDLQERMLTTDPAPERYDAKSTKALAKIAKQIAKLESIEPKSDEQADRIAARLEALEERDATIASKAEVFYDEPTKARGIVCLMLHADGRLERHYRVPRIAKTSGNESENGIREPKDDALPTSNELSANQATTIHTLRAVAVREAVATNKVIRKRLLVLALHPKVHSLALTVRRQSNEPVKLVGKAAGTSEPALRQQQRERFAAIDPLKDSVVIDDTDAYEIVSRLREKELDALIAVLVMETIIGQSHREVPLISLLAEEMKVSLRDHWTPDAEWLGGYQKAQLAHLIGELRGQAHGSAALNRKKSELVAELAGLFEKAAKNPKEIEEEGVADRVNRWVPGFGAASPSN